MLFPAGFPPKSQGLPFEYNKLSVRKLPTFAVSVTNKLLETFTKFAVSRLPKLALPEVILPITVKLVKLPTLVILG